MKTMMMRPVVLFAAFVAFMMLLSVSLRDDGTGDSDRWPTATCLGRRSDGLKEDLARLSGLLDECASTEGRWRRAAMRAVVEVLRDRVQARFRDEERRLFPAVAERVGEAKSLITASFAHEHRTIGRWIAELDAMVEEREAAFAAFWRRGERVIGALEAHDAAETDLLLQILGREEPGTDP